MVDPVPLTPAPALIPADSSLYQKAFRVSPVAVTITELATGKYLDVNEAFEELFGHPRHEVIGRKASDLGLWADPTERERLVELIRTDGLVKDFLATGRHRDGTLRTCSINGTVMRHSDTPCLVLVMQDITQQMTTERVLRETLEKFTKAFEANPDAVVLAELDTGIVLEANPGFTLLTGYSRAEVVGRRTSDMGLYAHPEHREEVFARLRSLGFVREVEAPLRRKDGRQVQVLFNAELLQLSGKPHILAVLKDMTRQRQAELEKVSLEAQLRRAQKLEALGTLAGGIAHDFNNILTAIMAYSEFAQLDLGDNKAVQGHLEEVRKAGSRAQSLVSRILAFSRQQRNEREPGDVQAVVRDAVALLRPALPASIEITEEYTPGQQIALLDAGQLHQVIMNLGTNAAHAMRAAPGRLSLSVARVPAPALLPGLRRREAICITITDTGHGMDEEVQRRLFEPFFTTKPQGEGTGLGLSVVHGIVREHGGTIEVRSSPGQGSTFTIYLPLHEERGEPATLASAAELPQGRGERILFIDDEPQLCGFALQLLTRLNYRVTTCCNPAEALAYFTGGREEFDLVLTDLTMPLLTGVDVARRLLARKPSLRIILMTGYSGNWTAERVRELGLLDLLHKPLNLESLARAVRRGCDAPQTTREIPSQAASTQT